MTVTAAALGGTVLARAVVLPGHGALAYGAVLAKGQVSSDNVTPGVLGFLVVAAMGTALYFLLRSMSRHLKKIPPPPAEDGAAGGANASAASSAVTGAPAPPGNRRQ